MMPDRDQVISGLAALIGASHVITDDAMMAPYLTDWRKRYSGRALCVVRPSTTEEVIAVMRFAKAHALAIVPQGGNTGLVGGSVPLGRGDEIVISFKRLNRIRTIDPSSDTVIVEAGAMLAALQDKAEEVGRLFPLSLASEGTATVGGAIATNAGGTAALTYGTMRDLVLGLEIVLPDGTLLNTLTTLRKDNTGYHLASLFMGAEGTLGVITAASLKLFPLPRARHAGFCGVKSPREALKLFHHLKSNAGPSLTTFELMPRFAIEIALTHIPGLRDPLSEPHEWYVMPEFSFFDS
ncbi:MAG: FAD-binding oxidoreductase, partial [Hyphomicrobiales bacterium]|nr:FAD-binding oxidoreductase [Hyphomicrobiales bacterium]